MSHLIAPIDVDGTILCCQDWLSGITETVDVGVPGGETNNMWNSTGQTIWRNPADDGYGGLAFGICCASSITLRIAGAMRILSNEEDDITLYLNNAIEWTTWADTVAGQAWYNHYNGFDTTNPDIVYPYYEGTIGGAIHNIDDAGDPPAGAEVRYHEITLALTSRACGNIIKLLGGQANTYPFTSAFSYWKAKITALT